MSETPPPPPPPGGYGAPPPPGPGGAAAGPPPSSGAYNVGDAASYGWTKFQANAGQIVIAGVVVLVGIVVFEVVGALLRSAIVTEPHYVCSSRSGYPDCRYVAGSGFLVGFLASMLMLLLFYVVYQVIGAAVIRGSLGLTEGKPFVFSDLLETEGLGPIIVTSLISSVVIFVGFVLCVLPGIVAAFFLQYALFFQIDKGLAPVDALKASATFVREHIGEVILWFLVSYLITIAGAIVCGVGLVVAIPVSLIGTAYTYKRLTGQAVAA